MLFPGGLLLREHVSLVWTFVLLPVPVFPAATSCHMHLLTVIPSAYAFEGTVLKVDLSAEVCSVNTVVNTTFLCVKTVGRASHSAVGCGPGDHRAQGTGLSQQPSLS